MPTDWIPFEEGEYWVKQAIILAPGGQSVALEQPYIEVVKTKSGQRHLVGRGLVYNLLVVELLEESDELDILLDLGGPYKYRLGQPQISAGKVFAADTKSTLQFTPQGPWDTLDVEAFEKQLAGIKPIDRGD